MSRRDRLAGCVGKRSFTSYRQAQQRVKAVKRKRKRFIRGEHMEIYRCSSCGAYHVGGTIK